MFELSVAARYLIPKKRSLSTALISIMSVVVISLVVWLVLVFLSITSSIEKNWLAKITSLHAPIRLSPTDAYYNSYFYQVDAISSASSYTYKTIGEKNEALVSNPFQPEIDTEIPSYFPEPEYRKEQLFDPVKSVTALLQEKKLAFQDYEIGGALMRITPSHSHATLSQMSYLLSIPDQNPHLASLFTEEKCALFPDGKLVLPDTGDDIPAILPKNYKDSGIKTGDRGTLSYSSFTPVSMQEQKVPFCVVGFYDPGIMSVGNKCILVPKEVTRDIYAATQTFSPDGTPTNGIFVWLDSLDQTTSVAQEIKSSLAKQGLSQYWNVATYEDFEFAKDLLLQFQSDKMLLLIIAAIILIVACCNIISLLVLLVNDKKREIAILQSMGASSSSIALIFGLCGTAMGFASCCIGSLAALLTLKNLDVIASLFTFFQGRTPFHPAFFGKTLPDSLSGEAFAFVMLATPILSLLAGLVPAIKASRIKPAIALRAE